MIPRYQVFVSSTFEDLKDERQAVLHALLKARFIPAGMELFTAGDLPPWDRIRQSIEESDYYALIVGGRYGSIVPDEEISYTEKEYRYALGSGIPIVAFIASKPGGIALDKSERTKKGAAKLSSFLKLVQQKMIEKWDGPNDLAQKLITAVSIEAQRNPRVGWVRGDKALSAEDLRRSLDLQQRVQDLEKALAATASTNADPKTRISKLRPLAVWLLRRMIYEDFSFCRWAGDAFLFVYHSEMNARFEVLDARARAELKSAIRELTEGSLIEGKVKLIPTSDAYAGELEAIVAEDEGSPFLRIEC